MPYMLTYCLYYGLADRDVDPSSSTLGGGQVQAVWGSRGSKYLVIHSFTVLATHVCHTRRRHTVPSAQCWVKPQEALQFERIKLWKPSATVNMQFKNSKVVNVHCQTSQTVRFLYLIAGQSLLQIQSCSTCPQWETTTELRRCWAIVLRTIIIIIIIIIKHVLIKVTLSCQRHCRGTAQSLTSKKE